MSKQPNEAAGIFQGKNLPHAPAVDADGTKLFLLMGTLETCLQTWDFRSWIAPLWPRPESRPNVQ